MSISFITLKCPECDAKIDVEEGWDRAFCTYCGAKILVNNENEYIYRKVDEARIKESEAKKSIRLRQLEIERENKNDEENAKIAKIKATVIVVIIGVILAVIGFGLSELTGDEESYFEMIGFIGFFVAFAIPMLMWGFN